MKLKGTGKYDINVLVFNADSDFTGRQTDLSEGGQEEFSFNLNVTDLNKPYVAVITAGDKPFLRTEIAGSYIKAEF